MNTLELLSKEKSKERFIEPNSIQTHNIIPGKFRVFHAGHLRMHIFANQVNHYVLIGKKNLKLRLAILENAIGSMRIEDGWFKIWYSPQGYMPSIVSQISEGQRINISAGYDRISDYRRQLEQAGMIDYVKLLESERICSSTKLIEKIQNGTWDAYDVIDHPWVHNYVERIKNEY